MSHPSEEWITAAAAAKLLGVSAQTWPKCGAAMGVRSCRIHRRTYWHQGDVVAGVAQLHAEEIQRAEEYRARWAAAVRPAQPLPPAADLRPE